MNSSYTRPLCPHLLSFLQVDRLWPRGLRKEAAHVDTWTKDLAPSTELRTWFGHDPAKWDEFQRRYTQELDDNAQVGATASYCYLSSY